VFKITGNFVIANWKEIIVPTCIYTCSHSGHWIWNKSSNTQHDHVQSVVIIKEHKT